MKWLKDRENERKREDFRQARRIAVAINRRKKRQALDRNLDEIESNRRHGHTRAQYQGINQIRKGYQPRQELIRNKEGKVLTNSEAIKSRWMEYFSELLNRPEPEILANIEMQDIGLEEAVELPTRDEILREIEDLKNNKAAGNDGVNAELIKYGGQRMQDEIVRIVHCIWNNEIMPGGWGEGVIIPFHKKNDRAICSNYRGICLLSVGYKILAKLLYKRLNIYCERELGDYQAGFRRGRSTIDQIFTIRQALEKNWEYDRDSWHIFVDFKQAYDSIHRESLWKILKYFRIPNKLVRLTEMCYENMQCRVRVGGELTDAFHVADGLKQGCPLSTLLFNLVLEWVMRQTPLRTAINIGEARYDRLAYADDVDLCGEDPQELENTLEIFREISSGVGLKINEEKTKILKVSRQGSEIGNMACAGMILEGVEEFRYLGTIITSENRVEDEVKNRIAAGARCLWALNDIFKSRNLSRTTKLTTYITIIRPILLYGCETWRLTKELERKLLVFENGVMRRIWGPIFDETENTWRRRHNIELREASKLPPITNIIRSCRLRWAGHVARMEDDRTVKCVMTEKPNGRRPLGRPRMRWEDNIKKDLELLGEETPNLWREVAMERERWGRLVKAAKDHMGPEPAE